MFGVGGYGGGGGAGVVQLLHPLARLESCKSETWELCTGGG